MTTRCAAAVSPGKCLLLASLVASSLLPPGAIAAPPRAGTALVLDAKLRAVRMDQALWDSLGQPIQYREWHDGSFKKTGDIAWVPVQLDGRKETVRMVRYLVIPGAPWIGAVGTGLVMVQQAEARAERVGEKRYVSRKAPGGAEVKAMMWKTTDTQGKWLGLDRDRIYERGDDGSAAQIGWLAYRDLALDSGGTARKVCMTKGMAADARWEGEVGDTTYREVAEGKGVPIARLEYRALRLEDGTESAILVSRALAGGGFVGVREGKVLEYR